MIGGRIVPFMLVALAAAADARPAVLSKALALRGGSLSSVSLCAAAPCAERKQPALVLRGGATGKKASIVLGLNLFTSVAYGVLGVAAPNAMLAIFGVTEPIAFMAPAFGVAQYLGGLHLAVAFRLLGAFGAPGFPARDSKAALQDMCALHTIAGLVAGFRQFKGSSSPVVGSVIMAGLAYWASKD